MATYKTYKPYYNKNMTAVHVSTQTADETMKDNHGQTASLARIDHERTSCRLMSENAQEAVFHQHVQRIKGPVNKTQTFYKTYRTLMHMLGLMSTRETIFFLKAS